MLRGSQGHVAEPRRPTRAPAWRAGDTWHAYLYLLVIYKVIVIISIRYFRFTLTLHIVTPYKLESSL